MYFVQEITTEPGFKPIIENQYFEATQAFYPSLIQSFLVIFLSEIADRTFILVLIYSLKMHWLPLIITSMLAMSFMNLLAIVAGYTVILLIPRSLIDWIGFACFLAFGIFSVYEGITMESKTIHEEYQEEMTEQGKNYQLANDEENNNNEANKEKSMWALCAELFGFLCLSELGDKSEISTVTIAAVYNLYAVLIGTMVAYFACILIATFLGLVIGKFLTEKRMTIIGGILFICFAIQILIIKIFGL
jgi:putative Ca2+/H+ antiporter (TMEM165/GDT1 family)